MTPDEHRYPPRPSRISLHWPVEAEERRRQRLRVAGTVDGPYRKPGWFARLCKRVAWLLGVQ